MTSQVERIGEVQGTGVVERSDTFSEKIERTVPGVQIVPTHFQAQVTDDQGRLLIQTPRMKTVTMEIPKPEVVLGEESKGSPDEAKTWLARFWLRLIEKARVFGWRVVGLLKGGAS